MEAGLEAGSAVVPEAGGAARDATSNPDASARPSDAGTATSNPDGSGGPLDAEAAVPMPDCAPGDGATCSRYSLGLISACFDPRNPSGDSTNAVFFLRMADVLSWFQTLATTYDLVVPAHGVDCTPVGLDAGECTYNPMTLQLDASDVHYSNAIQQFVGPDGLPYVWLYEPERNVWVFVPDDGQAASAAAYQLLVQYNECGNRPADQ